MFQLSSCIGLTAPQPWTAARYYQNAFGVEPVDTHDGLRLDLEDISLFVDPGARSTPLFELLTPDLDEAKRLLPRLGFEILAWNGLNRLNAVRDPFGLAWNIFEDPAAFAPQPLTPPTGSPAKPMIGAHLPDPAAAAQFFSRILDEPIEHYFDSSHVLQSGSMRLRLIKGNWRHLLFLSNHAHPDQLRAADFKEINENLWLDPLGVHWFLDPIPPSDKVAFYSSSPRTVDPG